MARIRVDTEDLKAKAKNFEAAADAFNRAGDEIAALAMAMPSYDGQLSGPARKAGFEIQSQAREMKAALTSDAQSLQKSAQDFENVDNQTIDLLSNNQSALTSIITDVPTFVTDPIKYGDSTCGYEYDPVTGKTTIYHNGKVLVYDTVPDDSLLEKNLNEFKEAAKMYELGKSISDAAFIIFLVSAGATVASLFLSPFSWPATIGAGLVAVGSLITWQLAAAYTDKQYDICDTLWNVLENGGEFSESYTTPTPVNPTTIPTATPTGTPSPTSSPTTIPTPTQTSTPTT